VGLKKRKVRSTNSKSTVLKQICNYFPAICHVVSLLQAQLSHSIGLNDVCDTPQLNAGSLQAIRGGVPPSRNGLSHANKVRPAEMTEKLFWGVLDHLGEFNHPCAVFEGSRRRPAFPLCLSTSPQLVS